MAEWDLFSHLRLAKYRRSGRMHGRRKTGFDPSSLWLFSSYLKILDQVSQGLGWSANLIGEKLTFLTIMSTKIAELIFVIFSPQMNFFGSIFLHMKAGKLWQNLPKFPKIFQNFSKISQNISTWQFFLHKYYLWYLWQIWALQNCHFLLSFFPWSSSFFLQSFQPKLSLFL